MGNIKKFNEFVNEGVVNEELKLEDSMETWGDLIVQQLHNNNEEKYHAYFQGFAQKLRSLEPEEAKKQYHELANYIRASYDSPSFFPENTEKHYYDLYFKKYFN